MAWDAAANGRAGGWLTHGMACLRAVRAHGGLAWARTQRGAGAGRARGAIAAVPVDAVLPVTAVAWRYFT